MPCCLALHTPNFMLELPNFEPSTANTLEITMFARARWRCLECSFKRHSRISDAAPWLRIPSQFPSRNFSATPIPNSKIGKAPLSIPPGVIFEVIPPVIGKRKRSTALQKQSLPTVHIKGPLGVHFCCRRSDFAELTKTRRRDINGDSRLHIHQSRNR